MTIPAGLWPELSPLFDAALALAPEARAAWLADLQQRRPDLALHVQALVAAHELGVTRDPLAAPPTRLMAEALASDGPALPPLTPGQMLGPYRLVAPIGAGGMASVWLAEQTLNIVRRVALKIPHQGLEDARAAAHRFAQERDLLAALEHPHIARLYDAAVSDEGRSYLAMEWIDGVPITRFADEQRMDLRQRIGLFLQVLQAVRHAHARLIIHRDIKPSNIIVTADGDVKLLDFGIARLLDDAFGDDIESGAVASRALTPETASPEQLAGRGLTTSSDVYSLGIVLFELLTGRRPYELDLPATERSAAAYYAALLAAPVTLASRVLIDAAAAEARRTTPAGLRRALTGDLDAILARALQRDPDARYESAEALADDLQRHLALRPVQARTGGWFYVAERALRRNQSWAIASALILLSLAAGGVGVLWQARLASQEAERATAVKNFLLQVFKASDPRVAADQPRGAVTARALLDIGAGRVEREFQGQPALQVELFGVLAEIYHELGEKDRYLHAQALRTALMAKAPGAYPKATAEVSLNLVYDAILDRDFPLARQRLALADETLRHTGLDRSVLRANWWVLTADSAEREQLDLRQQAFEKAIAIYRQAAPRDAGLVVALSELGVVYWERGDEDAAIREYQEALTAYRTCSDPDDGAAVELLANLSLAEAMAGRRDDALRDYQQTADLARRTYGEHHLNYWQPASAQARVLHMYGERDQALARFRELQSLVPFPPSDANGWTLYNNYANRLSAQGDLMAALPIQQALEVQFQKDPLDEHSLRRLRLDLGDTYARLGRVDEARATLSKSFEDYVAKEEPSRPSRLAASERWARQLMADGHAKAAETLFQAVVDNDRDRHLAATALAQAGLAQIALTAGQSGRARQLVEASLATWTSGRGLRDVRDGATLRRIQARVLLATGDAAHARSIAAAVLADSERFDAAGAASIAEARALVAAADKAAATR